MQMQALWAQVLKIKKDAIGANDSFFRLGGDSMAAMRLVSAARAAGVSLTVAEIFQRPSLRELSALNLPYNSLQNHAVQTSSDSEPNVYPTHPDVTQVISEAHSSFSAPDVEKVRECTDFQTFAVCHGELRSRGFTNYFIFDFGVPIEAAVLQSSCHALLTRHEILRTVFAVHELKLIQIILRRFPFLYSVHQCEKERLDKYCEQLVEMDKKTAVAIGHMITQFFAISFSGHGYSRLMIRLSHAQYDGISLLRILADFQKILQCQALSNPAPFRSFIDIRRTLDSSAAKKYWRKLLKGSCMTNICLNSSPERWANSDTKLVRQIPMLSLNKQNITFATILQAAWAIVLGRLSKKDDIVFGSLISGRSLSIDGIDKFIGPCVNILPVRVKLQNSVRILLQNIQEQHVLGIEHQHVGFDDIRTQCTDWPPMTRFSSIVQHQNLNSIPTRQSSEAAAYTMSEIISPTNCVDVWVISTPKKNSIEVSLGYCLDIIPASFAADVLDDLCDMIQYLGGNFYGELSFNFEDSDLRPQIPIVLPMDSGLHDLRYPANPLEVDWAFSLVEKVWETTFGLILGDTEARFDMHFSDLCDSLVAAIQISRAYCEINIRVDMDDILSHPTMRSQAHFISRKIAAT